MVIQADKSGYIRLKYVLGCQPIDNIASDYFGLLMDLSDEFQDYMNFFLVSF